MNFRTLRYSIQKIKLQIKSRFIIKKLYNKYYHNGKEKCEEGIFIIFDKDLKYTGLADRLYICLGLYWVSKKKNLPFYIIHQNIFNIKEYLNPSSSVNWDRGPDKISFSKRNSKIIHCCGTKGPSLNGKKQYHIYTYTALGFLHDYLENINYSELWNELFQPSDMLKSALIKIPSYNKDHISVHLRFINALDSFEEGYDNSKPSSECEKNKLINKCLKSVYKIADENPLFITVVFSDSKEFINRLSPQIVEVIPGEITHISFKTGNADAGILKSFIDFFIIMKSKRVFQIAIHKFHASGFSRLPAAIGGAEFKRINL
jgi:hypothetical protein